MKQYGKLVRDKIPDIIRKSGSIPVTHVLKDDKAFLQALLAKDLEESAELQKNPCLEELADKLEVLNAIAKELGYTAQQVEAARHKKAAERGGFDKRIFLDSTN